MEGRDVTTRRDKTPIERAIAHAVVAAGCRREAINTPGAARGLTKCADDHAATATELLALAVSDHVMGD